MLTIRQDQVEAFEQYHLQKFEDEMVEHMKKFSSRHWKVMGESDGRRVIRLGIEQAKKYGFTNHGPVRFYIELMFMFGSYFDSDPQHPWAGSILNAPRVDQMIRANRLYGRMHEYLAEVSGPEHQYLTEAMQRLSRVQIDSFSKPGVNLEQSILEQFESIYPQKCWYLGESALRSLINHGFNLAESYSFTTEKGRILMVALTFAVGHGFVKDPLYAWISRRLEDSRRREPKQRIEQLHSKSILYLQHILENE